MTTIGGNTVLTMTDLLKLMDPDGSAAYVAEVLHKENAIVKDMLMVEGNLPTGNQATKRSGLPSGTWRLFNTGVAQTKGRTVQTVTTTGMLDATSDIDYDLAKLNGNTAEWRMSQDEPHMEGMAQQAATALVYGNQSTDPEQITGLEQYYSDGTLGSDTASENMLDGGGTGSDNTSVLLVSWGQNRISGIYPKGMKGGLEVMDRGLIDLEDASGNPYLGYRKYFKWKLGLEVADWRYGARFCNIDVSKLQSDDGTVSAGADLIVGMIKMAHFLPENAANQVYYVNKTVYTQLDLQTLKQTNMNVSYGTDQHGQPVMTFRGIPVRKVEAILDTEAKVSFS